MNGPPLSCKALPARWSRVGQSPSYDYTWTAPDGVRYLIRQWGSKEWALREDGAWIDVRHYALKDAKHWAEDETRERLDPDLHASREQNRAARRARRLARCSA